AGGAPLMVGYMKRYDPGNELVRDTVARWRASGEQGRALLARAHGFCGDWTAGIEQSPLETSTELPPPTPTEENLPPWLPPERGPSYRGYLQQSTHNVNLLGHFLVAGERGRVKHVDFDAD